MPLTPEQLNALSTAFTAVAQPAIDAANAATVAAQADAANKADLLAKANATIATLNAKVKTLADEVAAVMGGHATSPDPVPTAPARAVVTIPAGTDLATIKQLANTEYRAMDGASYTATATIPTGAPNVAFTANGNPLVVLRQPGNGSLFMVNHPDFEFSGWNVDAAHAVIAHVAAPGFIARDLKYSRAAGLLNCDPAGKNTTALRCVAMTATDGDTVFTSADDTQYLDCENVYGSAGEHVFRASAAKDSPWPKRPVVRGGKHANPSPTLHKEVITFRNAIDYEVSAAQIAGGVRPGQDGPGVGAHCATGKIFDNDYYPDPNGVWDNVSFMNADGDVTGNRFHVNAAQRPISLNDPATCNVTAANNAIVAEPGVTAKDLIRVGKDGSIVRGTNTQVVVNAGPPAVVAAPPPGKATPAVPAK